MKVPFPEGTFKPINVRKGAGANEVIMDDQNIPGCNYLVEKFASEYNMYNNISPTVMYNSTAFPVNALPISSGQVCRVTLTKDFYTVSQDTYVHP